MLRAPCHQTGARLFAPPRHHKRVEGKNHMCGIVGYIGSKPALPILIDGLKRLEYRGYDSAGVAVPRDGRVEIVKTKGRMSDLEGKVTAGASSSGALLSGTVGMGHTRWATHGRPSDQNAHPHPDCTERFAVVHNGIIENYLTLKEELVAEGHIFRSETDTEVVSHLIEKHFAGDLEEAVRRTVAQLTGAFALVVVAAAQPDRIIAVKGQSPLVIGLGDGENFVASDVQALLPYTHNVLVLDEGEMATVTRGGVTVSTFGGRRIDKKVWEVPWDAVQAELGTFPHFMLKEIHEQPRALRDTLAGRISEDGEVELGLTLPDNELAAVERVFLVACGTAYHAGLVGRFLIERLARTMAEAEVASEFRYREPELRPGKDLMIVISQSGETADTLAALREAKRHGVRVIAVTNVRGSSVDREADETVYTWAGPEVAVASTKAYTTQIAVLTAFALHLARVKGALDAGTRRALAAGLRALPQKAQAVLAKEPTVVEFARECSRWKDAFFIGRGLDFAVALEGQLKLKEISYIHAEAYPAGELKHGTLALMDEGIPVVALATQDALKDKMASNITEVKARGASVLALVKETDTQIIRHADRVIAVPEAHDYLMPILAAIPLQLLAYHAAVLRGCDVDKPRHLAKSVTVE
jgi:glucosamine--fructose-6-phosphate aminotransferase (isomerizing)